MIIREIGASLRALFTRLSAKSTTIAGTETLYLDDAGSSVKATLSDAIRYGGGNSTRVTTIGNANISQKSDGTMWLEVTGQTAGNARGAGALDWQASRTNAGRVAAGAGSVCLGSENTAATYGTACGIRNTVSGEAGFAANGYNNIASTARYGSAFGLGSVADNYGQIAFGYGTTGKAQGSLQTFYTQTTSAASTQLNVTGTATERMTVSATRSIAFIGIVQAMCNVSSSSNFVKAWRIEGVITRDGSNTTRIVGTPIITELAKDTDGTPTPSTWAIASITADDTNEALAINVTGQAGTTINWQATVLYSQVGF